MSSSSSSSSYKYLLVPALLYTSPPLSNTVGRIVIPYKSTAEKQRARRQPGSRLIAMAFVCNVWTVFIVIATLCWCVSLFLWCQLVDMLYIFHNTQNYTSLVHVCHYQFQNIVCFFFINLIQLFISLENERSRKTVFWHFFQMTYKYKQNSWWKLLNSHKKNNNIDFNHVMVFSSLKVADIGLLYASVKVFSIFTIFYSVMLSQETTWPSICIMERKTLLTWSISSLVAKATKSFYCKCVA